MKKTGIELIAEERQRQIRVEGWAPEHDAEHKEEEFEYPTEEISKFMAVNEPRISKHNVELIRHFTRMHNVCIISIKMDNKIETFHGSQVVFGFKNNDASAKLKIRF